jgi:hypothetical protein
MTSGPSHTAYWKMQLTYRMNLTAATVWKIHMTEANRRKHKPVYRYSPSKTASPTGKMYRSCKITYTVHEMGHYQDVEFKHPVSVGNVTSDCAATATFWSIVQQRMEIQN